jgi:predicted ABC-type ATPase
MAMANALRRALVLRRESFVFETVFSDPVGDKVTFLAETASLGYTVVLCYIGIENAAMSEERVAMHVHTAIRQLPHVLVFDNSDLRRPYRLVATFERGQCRTRVEPLPPWLGAAEL